MSTPSCAAKPDMPAGPPLADVTGSETLSVSVLMPTYNQQDFVGAAIAAILSQDAPPFDLIIADDCSTDATWDRIKEAVAGYTGSHRVRLVRNERNLGVNGNLNRMIALATGNVLIAAAGDDVSAPDRVSRIVETFARQRPLLVHSAFKPLVPKSQVYDGRFDNLIFDRTTDPLDIAGSTALFVGATAAWHRDLFTMFGPLPEGAVYEDLILGFRASLAGRIAKIDAPLVEYRIGVGISAKAPYDHSRSTWISVRLAELKRHSATFAYRRADALAFGLPVSSAVVRALDWHILSTSIRMDYWLLPTDRFFKKNWRHPILALRRIRSERRGARRALNTE